MWGTPEIHPMVASNGWDMLIRMVFIRQALIDPTVWILNVDGPCWCHSLVCVNRGQSIPHLHPVGSACRTKCPKGRGIPLCPWHAQRQNSGPRTMCTNPIGACLSQDVEDEKSGRGRARAEPCTAKLCGKSASRLVPAALSRTRCAVWGTRVHENVN